MTEESFDDFVASFIRPFEQLGFRQVEKEYHPSDFGNALATYENDVLRIRILSDRDQIFIEIGSPESPDEWFDLRLVLEFLGETINMPPASGEEELKELQSKLLANYDKVRSLFDRNNYYSTKARLVELRKARAKKLFESV